MARNYPAGRFYRMPIPENLRRLREEREMSQVDLARAAKVSQQLISQLERGENLTTKKLPAIARALNATVSDLDEEYGGDHGAGVVVSVPLISWVSAGALLKPDSPVEDEDAPIVLLPDLDPSGDWIALRVDGDSMNKISPPDSVIFVNRKERRLVPNACYIIGDGEGGATYKRYRPPNTWEPVSTNPAHQPMKLKAGREPDIIGRVRRTLLSM